MTKVNISAKIFLMKNLEIYTNYYNKFHCSASNCVSTCCTGWKIRVDNKTYKKYLKLDDSKIKDYILENISDTQVINLKKNFCPFIDENKLCFIQKNYGHDMLCDVCKIFPRDKQAFKDIIFNDLLISCPEVIKLIKDEKLFNDSSNLQELDVTKLSLQAKLLLTLQQKLKIIYNFKFSFKKSVYLLLVFNKDIKPFFDKEITEEAINKINLTFNENYFKLNAKNYKNKKDYFFILKYLKNLLPKIKSKTGIVEVEALFNNFQKEDFDSVNFKYLFKLAIKKSNKTMNLKNILFYLLNQSLIEIVCDNNFNIHCLYAILFMLSSISFSMLSILDEGTLLSDNCLKFTSFVYRYLYHSKKVREIVASEIVLKVLNEENLIKFFSSF